ncbi:hypothetical protein OG792_10370 [Micromonospora sp. NBC_01699]|uniref:hypothetical protein n=1 Tax=Micromonospora sp. NBC_01699 TaxID=2975984 RepID=UPI002E3093F6|nr:hypothetical protein [Micromonospora sp. NBC_01699]
MALGDGGDPAADGGGDRTVSARQAQHWLLTLVPTFPLLLLVLRLWHLSRQDLSTMLVLVQYVSPLGLLSSLLITLVWVLPLVVLVVAALGTLYWVSAADRFDPERSLLARATARLPGWVIMVAVLLALLTWQFRFLPSLLMLALAILGLRTRQRHPDDRLRRHLFCLVLPLVATLLAGAWLAPAVIAAVRADEPVTVLLLALPPVLVVFLTGPVPRPVAPVLTRWVLVAAALTAPFLLGAIFLRAPILPTVAVEIVSVPQGREPDLSTAGLPSGAVEVLIGRVISVDDRMTTLLDEQGSVRFVRNDRVWSQTLCPELERVPYSTVRVRGWQVEETALEWAIPRRTPGDPDPRCSGRPVSSPPTQRTG